MANLVPEVTVDQGGTILLDALGAVGDGVTDDTAIMTLACSGLYRKVKLRGDGNYVIGDVKIANGVTVEGNAGRDYTAIHAYMRPRFTRKAGCASVFDLNNQVDANNFGRAITLRGIAIDGVDNTCNGISAGSVRLNLDRVYITNCTNGIGGASPGGSSYTRVLDATGLIITNCTVTGVRDLIDSRLNSPEIAACGIGIKATAGANHWQVTGGRIEWNTNENVRLDASGAGAPVSRVKFIGTEFDRGGAAGVFCNNVTDLQMVGCTHDRACASNTGALGQRAQIHLENVSDVTITDGRFLHGRDDGGSGIDTPPYAIETNGTVTNLVWTGGSVSNGYLTSPIHYNSGRTTTAVPGHKITGVGGVEDFDNTSALYKADGRVFYPSVPGSSAVMNPADSQAFVITVPPIITFSSATFKLTIDTRDADGPSTSPEATFKLKVWREGGNAAIRTNVIEQFTAGAIAFGGATFINLSIGSIATDGSSFTLTATNAHATHHIRVFVEVTPA